LIIWQWLTFLGHLVHSSVRSVRPEATVYKIFKSHCNSSTRYKFFAHRVVTEWIVFASKCEFQYPR